jgi:hypothetical protein
MKYFMLFIAVVCSVFFAATDIHASVITYTFETSTLLLERRDGVVVSAEEQLFTSADTISASLDYDNAAAPSSFQPVTWGTYYQNVQNISAAVGGTFSTGSIYPSGWTFVSNDGFTPGGSTEQYDAIWVQTSLNPVSPPVTGSPQLSDSTGELFVLREIRFFWLENQIGIDFFSDEALPATLPGFADGPGGIALIFKPVDPGSIVNVHVVVAPITVISGVPIPAAIWLFASGLAWLGWVKRVSAVSKRSE